jgi:hypothetical protein
MDEINIKYDYTDIEHKTDSEKLTLLLKIAFSNHEALMKHSKAIYGNGQEGLLDACRFHNRSIKGLWIIVLSSIAGFAGILFTYLLGH